ncbi:MAG: aryldialkylphosphatase [Leifsonia sp.]|nr:aryldialkylphosphatase [Leifsonia sp.]
MAIIRTVLGDIEPRALSEVNGHEHLFHVSPLLPGDELDDPERSLEEAGILRASGFSAMIDATPIGLGRRPRELAEISARSGLVVIASTGMHREAHYGANHPLREWSSQERAAAFIRDIVTGMPESDEQGAGPAYHSNTPVRAGMIKVGIDYWSISDFERRTLYAAAIAHADTGAAIMVHLEYGTAGHEVLDLLESFGVDAARVMLAHADRLIDAGHHAELLARGCALGYDGVARWREHSDSELLELTADVIERGYDRILLGGDVARASRFISYGGMPGLGYLGTRYVPRLRERIGADVVERMLTTHPRALVALPHVPSAPYGSAEWDGEA